MFVHALAGLAGRDMRELMYLLVLPLLALIMLAFYFLPDQFRVTPIPGCILPGSSVYGIAFGAEMSVFCDLYSNDRKQPHRR